ncbi:NAC domain-containing protein 72 [Striga hermonthica]|uniref:NAC domain-containing protein 72 n=1 Tax=Striga hermonthica TaxID=68872 RepID=A0A9N7NY21_STRHE|nr:NAC domain-containing protein 72 [Striga hermonthica]
MAAPVDDYPMGMRFNPTDEECCRYLVGTVTGNPVAGHHLVISAGDLFGEKEPWEFFSAEDEHQERYFYTRLKRVAKNNASSSSSSNQRYSRNIGKGTWSNKGQRVLIHGEERGELLGYKRAFRYVPRKECSGADRFGEWILKEYMVPDHELGQVKPEFKDYVLCLLRKKNEKNKKKRKSGPGGGLGESDSGPDESRGLAYLLSTLGDQSRPAGRSEGRSAHAQQPGCGNNVNNGGYFGHGSGENVGYVVLEDDNLQELISFDMDNKESVRSLDGLFVGSVRCGDKEEEYITYSFWPQFN